MEAVPRLPMISFQMQVSPEPTTFGPKLKQVQAVSRFIFSVLYSISWSLGCALLEIRVSCHCIYVLIRANRMLIIFSIRDLYLYMYI